MLLRSIAMSKKLVKFGSLVMSFLMISGSTSGLRMSDRLGDAEHVLGSNEGVEPVLAERGFKVEKNKAIPLNSTQRKWKDDMLSALNAPSSFWKPAFMFAGIVALAEGAYVVYDLFFSGKHSVSFLANFKGF